MNNPVGNFEQNDSFLANDYSSIQGHHKNYMINNPYDIYHQNDSILRNNYSSADDSQKGYINNSNNFYDQNGSFFQNDYYSLDKQKTHLTKSADVYDQNDFSFRNNNSKTQENDWNSIKDKHLLSLPTESNYNFGHADVHALHPSSFHENIPHTSINTGCKDNCITIPQYSIYEETKVQSIKSSCETFDYNHGDMLYSYYDKEPLKMRESTISFSEINSNDIGSELYENTRENSRLSHLQNNSNLIEGKSVHNEIIKNSFIQNKSLLNVSKEKLYSETSKDLISLNGIFQNQISKDESLNPSKTKKRKITEASPNCTPWLHSSNNQVDIPTSNLITKPTKKVPAWIIDDIQKLRKKDEFQTHNSNFTGNDDMDNDVIISEERRPNIMSRDNNICLPRPVRMASQENIDVAQRTLIELVDMIDGSDIDTIKINFMRDSLTSVMKDVTDEMISLVTMSAFHYLLTCELKNHRVSKTKAPNAIRSGVTGQLLGLDVYESDDNRSDGLDVYRSDDDE